jgi:UDP-N-acetylglucosamine--N-acetylmuramyl-(pentapeptide) pyrophosphoryl-undecaprenol N-acetylglucosamine transferase
MTWLFATGGTGGHIFPALAIAKEACIRGHTVAFIGHQTGMEARLIPEAGFDFYGVAAGKLDRQHPNPLQGLKALQGLNQARSLIKKLKPTMVIGFGGFASFPGIAAARWLSVPYVLHEVNAFPGLVTRWFAAKAQHLIVTQKESLQHLPKVPSSILGFPVREERIAKEEARKQLGLPKGLVTLVMGGSQGSVRLNQEIPKSFERLTTPTLVLHSSGKQWEDRLKTETQHLKHFFVHGFLNATAAWSVADLAITRAGFGTLSEAAFHGVPLIMIPLPTSAENHQLLNAKAFAQKGAGWVVEEHQLQALPTVWDQALQDTMRHQAGLAAQQLSPQGATPATLDVLESVLKSCQRVI